MLSPVERMKLNHGVEKVLHAPGGSGQGSLEMAIVFDMNLEKERARTLGKDICDSLKSHSKVFQNVRLNAIRWQSDGGYVKEISAMPLLQMGRYFDDYEMTNAEKRLELLAEQLKKFYARSKLIILLTDGTYTVEDKQKLICELKPFLYRRLIVIRCTSTGPNDFEIIQGLNLMKTEG